MKKIIWILLFGVMACREDGDGSDTPDQLLLLSDREVVCPGQTATLRLFSTKSRQEVPISDFVFDPLANENGSISAGGLLILNFTAKNGELPVSGTFRGKTKLSTNVKVKSTTESSTPSVVISPFGFYNPDQGRPFYFWPDGSVVIGTEKHGPESLKKFEVLHYSGLGVLKWKKEFGAGEAKFIEVRDDKIFAAGSLTAVGGAFFIAVMVFDRDGNLIWEKKIPTTPQHVIYGFQVDDKGYFFVSTGTIGSTFVAKLAKYNAEGEQIWEKEQESGLEKLFVFPNGSIAGCGSKVEGWLANFNIKFFDEYGDLIETISDNQRKIFKGPENTLGVGNTVFGNENSSIYFMCIREFARRQMTVGVNGFVS